MPKTKPDQVIRHEIALSRPLMEAADTLVMGQTIRNMVIPAGITLAAAGIGVAGYSLYQWLKDGPFEDILQAKDAVVQATGLDNVGEFVRGEKTYAEAWTDQAKGVVTGEKLGPVWVIRKIFGK